MRMSGGGDQATQAAAAEVRDANELRRIGGQGLNERAEARGPFARDHSTKRQFQLRGSEPSFYRCRPGP